MNVGRFAKQFTHLLIAFLITGVCPAGLLGQTGHSHATANQQQTAAAGELVKVIRENTAKYKDVSAAQADGYSLLFGCVTGPDSGAMGLHYVNMSLVASGVIDPTHPQIEIGRATCRER